MKVACVFFLLAVIFQVAFASFQVSVSTNGTAPSPRLYPRAAALSDGTVLIHGGTTTGSAAGATADVTLFNTNTLEYSTPFLYNVSKIYAHSVAVDSYDNVYYFGGNNGAFRTNDLHFCNLVASGCYKLDPYGTPPPARTLAGMVYWNNSLIIFGGANTGILAFYNDVWQYDIAANTWTNRVAQEAAGSPPGRTAVCVAVYQSQLIISGGSRFSAAPGTTYYRDTWILDLNTWTWTDVTATMLPSVAHADAACTVDGNHLLIYGGNSGSTTISKTLDMFHIPTRSWVAAYENVAGVGRFGVANAFVNGKWYLFGGSTSSPASVNTLDIYTPDEPEYTTPSVTVDTHTEGNQTAAPGCNSPTPIVSAINSSTSYVLPSQPSVSVSYDENGNLFFQVAVDFVQDEASYFLDFAAANVLPNATGSSCANHYNSYGSFYNTWQSPPNYNTAVYGNYGTWPSSPRWSMTALDCNRISLSASIPVNGCSDQYGRPLISASTEGDKIIFEGTLFIALNRATSIYTSDRMDTLVTWKQPFRLELSNTVASISSLTVRGEGNVNPPLVRLTDTGGLVLQIVSELKESSSSGTTNVRAGNPVVLSSPVGLVLSGDNNNNGPACVSPCTQAWTWNSQTNSPDYSGVYRFQFTVLSASNKRFVVGSTFTVSLQVQLKPNATIYLNGSSLSTSVDLYHGYYYYWNTGNVFNANERVYAVQNLLSTPLSLSLYIKNAWFCYDAVWNPMAGQMGCLSASPSKVVQLVSNGYIGNTTVYEVSSLTFSNTAVGLSFVAVPLSPYPQNYLLHIESTVQVVGRKRNTETTSKQQVISFSLKEPEPIQEEVNSSASVPSTLFAFGILIVALLL